MAKQPYSRSVFINCPFDINYRLFFNAVVFAVFDCGYVARCAQEIQDSSQTRIEKIFQMISECQFGIHDLSRTELDANNLPRFNMPFELGIFLGAKRFGEGRQRKKTCIVLDKERYRYQLFISDIAGQDIVSHENDEDKIIQLIRDWLSDASRRKTIPGYAETLRRYNLFKIDLPSMCTRFKLNPSDLTFNDYCNVVSVWLAANP